MTSSVRAQTLTAAAFTQVSIRPKRPCAVAASARTEPGSATSVVTASARPAPNRSPISATRLSSAAVPRAAQTTRAVAGEGKRARAPDTAGVPDHDDNLLRVGQHLGDEPTRLLLMSPRARLAAVCSGRWASCERDDPAQTLPLV